MNGAQSLVRTLLAAGWTDRADSARINGFAVVLLMWLLSAAGI